MLVVNDSFYFSKMNLKMLYYILINNESISELELIMYTLLTNINLVLILIYMKVNRLLIYNIIEK